MKPFLVAFLFSLFPAFADKPNILLIVADDMGFSDLGCYGSEIDTPVITPHPVFWAFTTTACGYLDYPWKINSTNNGPWQLFNLENDPSETVVLNQKNAVKLKQLASDWEKFAPKKPPCLATGVARFPIGSKAGATTAST